MILNFLRLKPAIVLAELELENAKRDLLREQTLQEYCAAQVTYNQARIKRLTAYLEAQVK